MDEQWPSLILLRLSHFNYILPDNRDPTLLHAWPTRPLQSFKAGVCFNLLSLLLFFLLGFSNLLYLYPHEARRLSNKQYLRTGLNGLGKFRLTSKSLRNYTLYLLTICGPTIIINVFLSHIISFLTSVKTKNEVYNNI